MNTQLLRFILISITASLTNLHVGIAHPPTWEGNIGHSSSGGEWQSHIPHRARSSANLDAGEPYTVRLIYFLPRGRQPKPDIDAKFDTVIRDVQQFYADVMKHHGFGGKTFRFETGTTGKAIVHHVIGIHDEAVYRDWAPNVLDEINERFDTTKNIDLIALETSNDFGGRGIGNSTNGKALLPAFDISGVNGSNVDTSLVVHELGHAFGLRHDARDDINLAPVSQNSTDAMASSLCAAEWFNVHRYFNTSQNPVNANTSIHMLTPTLAAPPLGIRLQFQVADFDGLHQAQLVAGIGGDLIVIDCKRLSGTSATLEFVTTRLLGVSDVGIRVIDKYGNYSWVGQLFKIDINPLLPPSETVSIPDSNLASAIRESFNLASGDPITRLHMEGLRGLNARNRQITNLTGLQYAINIKFLRLDGNQISDITPLAGLTELLGLLLTENQIGNISPLAKLKNLGQLWLRQNQISDISSLAALTKLFSLGLEDNQISDITPLAGLTSLKELWLSGNQISDITPLAGATENLEWVLLGRNLISDISPLADLTRLRILAIEDNSISDISPLADNTGLGIGDEVNVIRNPLSYQSIYTHMPAFQAKGVEIRFSRRTPERIRIVSGDDQGGLPGAALEKPFVVEVEDQNGVPFQGVPITFAVTGGDGTLNTTSAVTDANGRAESTLTLGSTHGTNTVRVRVEGSTQAVALLTIESASIPMFTLSIPKGIHIIHVPLAVNRINGEDGAIETVGDLYNTLGDAARYIITLSADGNWISYLGDESAGSMADAPIKDDTGLIAVMKEPKTLELMGGALGTAGASRINLLSGNNLVGLPLQPAEGFTMISDLLVDGVGAIAVSKADGNGFNTITKDNLTADAPLMGGVGYLVVYLGAEAASISIIGSAWEDN